MKLKRFDQKQLKNEYGLMGIRLLPWSGAVFPFGGAYCIVKGKTSSLEHVNSPSDEEELFICISGEAIVHIDDERLKVGKGDVVIMPRGTKHYVENKNDEDFHFYALWWNSSTVRECAKHLESGRVEVEVI